MKSHTSMQYKSGALKTKAFTENKKKAPSVG